MNKTISRTAKRTDESVQIRAAKEIFVLPIAAIKYLEVEGHYIVYHTTGGNFTEHITLKEAEKKLDKPYFVRCYRCYLVNLKYVSAVRDDVVLVGRDEPLISRPQKKGFLNALAVSVRW